MNQHLTKTLTAAAAVLARRIVKFNSTGGVIQSAAAADNHIGVSDPVGDVASGARIDVTLSGIVEVEAGAAIAFGAPVTANASGKAVTATAEQVAIGWAFNDAAADGDVILVFLARHMISEAAA